LPYSKHAHSKLICSVTGDLMSDANPPMVLPNGFVYSQKAVAQIMGKQGGKVVCPQTGATYTLDELRRAFIV
jgi:macrophage erythroblast attacher